LGEEGEVLEKQCKKCLETFPSTSEFFYKHKSSRDGLFSSCKECSREYSANWKKENETKWREYYKERDAREHYKAKRLERNREDRKSGKYLEWQRNNKDKIKTYREKRQSHKNHDISNEELAILYDYANSSCMYCGISETEAKAKYNNNLHKDHAYNNGSDGIDNCVLACKGCNSIKHNKDWDEWFISSEVYDEIRYDVIASWLQMWKDEDEGEAN